MTVRNMMHYLLDRPSTRTVWCVQLVCIQVYDGMFQDGRQYFYLTQMPVPDLFRKVYLVIIRLVFLPAYGVTEMVIVIHGSDDGLHCCGWIRYYFDANI